MQKILFLIMLFIVNTTINAQNKEEFDKSVDYCASKIAYAYTNEYINKGKPNKYKENDFNKEKKSFENIIKPKIENSTIEKHITFKELSKLLKENNFEDFGNKLSKVIIDTENKYSDNLSKTDAINNIISGIYENEEFEGIIKKYKGVDSLKSNLKEELKKSLPSFKDEEPIENTTKIEENTDNQNEQTTNSEIKNNSFFPNWLLFVLILISSILLFLYNYLNNKKLNKRISRRLSRNEYEQNRSTVGQFDNQNNINSQFKKDIRSITNKITDLNYAIEKLQKESLNNQHTPKNEQIINTPKKNKQNETQKIAYAKTPINENTFNAYDVSEEKENKFYKFIITNNNNEAAFEFFNTGNSAKRAVNGPDTFLYPVCEETESLNQRATKIITKEPGVAIKQEDKWIVTKKAKIAYE